MDNFLLCAACVTERLQTMPGLASVPIVWTLNMKMAQVLLGSVVWTGAVPPSKMQENF